jgi:uncharacterized membrane protein YozB (DUF420 family)
MADVILAALVLGPLLLTFFLKSNAAMAFLSLCAGFAVISFASTDLENLTGHLDFSINSSVLNLVLIGLPLIFTLLLVRHAFTGKVGMVLHCLIALATGALLAVIAVPLLSDSVRANFADSKVWSDLQKVQSEVIGAGVLLSLGVVWVNGLKHHKPAKKKHK